MRSLLIITALALLPMAVVVHAWQFMRTNQPELEQQALALLRQAGIRGAAANLRFLDLHVTGNAPDPESLQRANAALEGLRPARLVMNELTVPASLRASVEAGVLRLQGWLPDAQEAARLKSYLSSLRPDLKMDTAALNISPQVKWPEGISEPLAEDGPFLAGILDKLRATPTLRIQTRDEGIIISGALPSTIVRDSILRALKEAAPERPIREKDLLISRHMVAAAFAADGALAPFVRSFFSTPSPGNFSISDDAGPVIEASATPSLEAEWLRLLREVSGGKKVEMKLTVYPSVFHFPGYRPQTPLAAQTLEDVQRVLSDTEIVFDSGGTTLPTAARAQLAGLASTLLSAGPALRLVVGGHPDPGGDVVAQRRLALGRAEQVRSYLVEQGAPAGEIQALAFDPVPADSPRAPKQERSVEILIK
jgi:outer membrane protein OmpA-like peptidoglycan-associated protein